MSDELKAAVERLRMIKQNRQNGDNCWLSKVYPSYLDWNRDMRIVSCDYLAEHPADDDEPLSAEWLGKPTCTDEGYLWSLGVNDLVNTCCILKVTNPITGEVAYYFRASGVRLRIVVTRGDVRRLCRALSIEINE